jgi:acetyltransferase-like isoleucine patch superfamily enzyme
VRALLLGLRPGVQLGRAVRVERGVRVEVARGARLEVGDRCVLGADSRLVVRDGVLRLGAGVVIGEGCRLVVHAGATLGDGCVLGPQAAVIDAAHSFEDVDTPIRRQPLAAAPVVIGARVVFEPGAAVLAGAVVPDGAVLGARSVTTPAG